jgi:hypothetical protein
MGPEIWVALAAVFVSGGAVGTAGTLLTQWLVRRFDGASPAHGDGNDATQAGELRAELTDMARQLRNLDARPESPDPWCSGSRTSYFLDFFPFLRRRPWFGCSRCCQVSPRRSM